MVGYGVDESSEDTAGTGSRTSLLGNDTESLRYWVTGGRELVERKRFVRFRESRTSHRR